MGKYYKPIPEELKKKRGPKHKPQKPDDICRVCELSDESKSLRQIAVITGLSIYAIRLILRNRPNYVASGILTQLPSN